MLSNTRRYSGSRMSPFRRAPTSEMEVCRAASRSAAPPAISQKISLASTPNRVAAGNVSRNFNSLTPDRNARIAADAGDIAAGACETLNKALCERVGKKSDDWNSLRCSEQRTNYTAERDYYVRP